MRKCLIHGAIYLLLAALVAGAAAYALTTNPAAVRGMVQEQLSQRFCHVSVSVERARLRLLGGILVRELRLARNDGLDRRDFLYAPTAIIYHDKEHVLDGQILVKKVELPGPQIRIVRERDGKLNVADVLTPPDLSASLPTLVVRGGVVTFEDRACGPGPLLEIRDVSLTVINDPLPTLQVEGSGRIDVLGPVRFRGTVNRASGAADLTLELPEVPINRDLVARLAIVCPDVGRHLGELTGRVELVAHVRVATESDALAVRYDVKAKLRDARFAHQVLPGPLEAVSADVHLCDGRFPTMTMQAKLGSAMLDVRLADVPLPTSPLQIDPLELGGEMDVSITGLSVDDNVLSRLSDDLSWLKKEYAPSGPVNVSYRFRKSTATEPVVRLWVVQPRGMAGCFEPFPYPFHDVHGTIRIDNSRLPHCDVAIDLVGKARANDSPLSLRGTIKGPRNTSEMNLDVTMKDVLLDDKVDRALQHALAGHKDCYDVVGQFLPLDSRLSLATHPLGTGHLLAQIRRPMGSEKTDKRWIITFENCRACYDLFPYPVEDVSGVLDLRPDGWECRDFRATHNGGEFFVSARSERMPGPGDQKRVRVWVRGKDVFLDHEFAKALALERGEDRRGLRRTWESLKLAGRLSFTTEVIHVPGQPQDVTATVGVQGCTLRPKFFDYPLTDVCATVQYSKDRVLVKGMRARHGKATLGMDSALVVFKPEGAYTAWLEGVSGRGVVADRDLLGALPEGLRKAAEMTAFRDPFDLSLNLTVDAPQGGQGPLKFWWESGVGVRNARFEAGVEVSRVDGGFFCQGHHDGRQLRGVKGNVVLDRATVLNQPVTGAHCRLEIRPDTPEVMRLRDFKADLFGGTLAGEARLDLSPTFRYDVYAEAVNVQLDKFGQHNLGAASRTAQLSGPARGAVHLTGEGSELLNLKGNGQLEVRQGKMGQLPVLLDLVKAFGLRMPDRTAFEQAQLTFGLEGPRVIVQQLELYGNAISLRGQGTCDLDGDNLNLDFTTSPGRLSQLLPPGLDGIPDAISQQLYKIKMRGKLSKSGGLSFEQVPVPAVVEPLRRAMRQ